jgi:hypothetical protein
VSGEFGGRSAFGWIWGRVFLFGFGSGGGEGLLEGMLVYGKKIQDEGMCWGLGGWLC